MTQECPGTVGDYELLELIGSGAQGHVYRARCSSTVNPNVESGRIVAIRIVACSGRDHAAGARIDQSSAILRKLSHKNIVKHLDSFPLHRGLDESRCLVTEFLDGETLEERMLKHPDGLPWKAARHVFDQCAEGMIHAHEKGVVHRDLKPSNIFILGDETAKLIDFDIARCADAATTDPKDWVGSFDYMAPDFARVSGFRGDELSDIFGLGACFYRALTGKLPFKKLGADADVEYLRRWRIDREPTLSFQPPIFRILDRSAVDFFVRAMQPDRSQRYQAFALMSEALRGIRSRTIAGKETYELESLLGHGGFGEVYLARCVRDGRPVAVKRLFADSQSRRFIKEARLLQRLRHEHLVEYVDFVDIEDIGDKHHYFLVMELLAGIPDWALRNRIRKSAAGIELTECLELFSHYLECLEYLHDHRIIHRDIKPANLYAPEGNPAGAKVFDLGIARDISGTATSGNVPGTLEYMPPELGREGGGRGSPQSDIYSTGLSLYETLCGKPAYKRLPADERQAFQQFYQRASGPGENVDYELPPFTHYPKLAAIVRKATNIRPKARYASAVDMRRDIEAARAEIRLAGERTTADRVEQPRGTVPTLAPDPSTAGSAGASPTNRATRAEPFSKTLLAAGVAAAIMIVAIVCGVWGLSGTIASGPGTGPPSRRAGTNAAPAAGLTRTTATFATSHPPARPVKVVPAVSPGDPNPAELARLAAEIDGEVSALSASFSLAGAEAVALKHKRADAVSSRAHVSSTSPQFRDRQRLQSGMSRLVLVTTSQVSRLAELDDISGLRNWPKTAPALTSIPAVERSLEQAIANMEEVRTARNWLDRSVTIEAGIADLSAANAETGIRRLQQETATLERDAASNPEKRRQVDLIAERISSRCCAIAGELCGEANRFYASDNLKAGDTIRQKAENFKNLVPDRFGRSAVDRLLEMSMIERGSAVRRLAAAERSRREAVAQAERTRAKGARLDFRALLDDPPATIAYRMTGADKWDQMEPRGTPIFLPPGGYSFRFIRPDYEDAETAIIVPAGIEAVAVPLPATWKEKDCLNVLRAVENAVVSEPMDVSTLDAVFARPAPAFEWAGHAVRFKDLRERWDRLRGTRLADAVKSAEQAVSGYVLWLYQVRDPATGIYRRYGEPAPDIVFTLPAITDVGTNAAGELGAQLLRLKEWETAGKMLRTDGGRKHLATSLARCAERLESGSAQQSVRCRFEAALLPARPGEVDPALDGLHAPDEVARWRAHASYTPGTSSLGTLKHLAKYAEKNENINACDIKLGLYSAFYTWHNAIAGEHQYALEVNTALGTVLGGLDRTSSKDAVAFLGAAILRDDRSSQEDDSCLYMMKALAFMPGLAHGSELKRQAGSWLDNHVADPIVARREARIHDSLCLLKTLLRVTE